MKVQISLARYGDAATEPMKIDVVYLYTVAEAYSHPKARGEHMVIDLDNDFTLRILARHAAALAHAILDAQRKRSQELVAHADKDASNG